MNFLYPYLAYLFWAVLYYIFNFELKAKKIKEEQYRTLYVKFSEIGWSKNLMTKIGPKWSPFVFMCFHCTFFSFGHVLAICSFYSMWCHTILMIIWLSFMVWNGAGYYAKNFSYDYKLEQIKNEKK